MAKVPLIEKIWNEDGFKYNKKGFIYSSRKSVGATDAKGFLQYVNDRCRSLGIAEFTLVDVTDSIPRCYNCDEATKQDKYVFNSEELSDWLHAHKSDWKISEDGKMITRIEGGIPRSSDIDDLSIEIYVNLLNNGLFTSKDAVRAVLQQWLNSCSQRAAIKLAEDMKYDDACVAKTDAYIMAMYKYLQPTQSFDVFRMMVYHWAWQVKRKVMGKPVANHIWLSFYGGAGIGKTSMIKRIVEPFGCFAVDTTLGKVLDSTKEIKLLTESYILNADEIAVNREDGNQDEPLTKDQMNLLKAILTGEDITARVYGTQLQARRKISFSVISTSNEHLYNIIFDDATMRRYYEINCTRKQRDVGMLDDFKNKCWGNGLLFWRGVNENLSYGYWFNYTDEYVQTMFPNIKELTAFVEKEQREYYPENKTTVLWLRYLREEKERGFVKCASLMDLYGEYTSWCSRAGCNRSSMPKFRDTFISKFAPYVIDGSVSMENKSKKWCELIGIEYQKETLPF